MSKREKRRSAGIIIPSVSTIILAQQGEGGLFVNPIWNGKVRNDHMLQYAHVRYENLEHANFGQQGELYVLMVQSTGYKSRPKGQITFPGGKLEIVPEMDYDQKSAEWKDRLQRQTAVRETREESGMIVKPEELISLHNAPIIAPLKLRDGTVKTYSVVSYLALNSQKVPVGEVGSRGSQPIWVNVKDLAKLRPLLLPNVERMLKMALEKRKKLRLPSKRLTRTAPSIRNKRRKTKARKITWTRLSRIESLRPAVEPIQKDYLKFLQERRQKMLPK